MKAVTDGDDRFDSLAEYRRWKELNLLLRAGLISDLRRQVRYELIPKQGKERTVYYIADFVYAENGETVVEDVKGVRTKEYIIKRKLMLYRYGILQ
ncbi:MAG: DUF1064 domain-containing protein [Eubacteriales bacterium]